MKSKTETLIVAHRGASYAAPENTIPSFKLALDENADFIEGDFWLTANNEIVCIHDSNTRRTAPNQLNLKVKDSELSELKKLDFSYGKGDQYVGTRIPTLDEVLEILPEGKGLFIEIKDSRDKFFHKLKSIIESFKIPNHLIRIIAFDPSAIMLSKKYLPDIKCYWLYNWYFAKETSKLSNTEREILNTLKILNADGIDINVAPWISAEFVEALNFNNFEFIAWTVDSIEDAVRFLSIGVDAITTNYPLKMRSEIDKYYSPIIASINNEERIEFDENGNWKFYPPAE